MNRKLLTVWIDRNIYCPKQLLLSMWTIPQKYVCFNELTEWAINCEWKGMVSCHLLNTFLKVWLLVFYTCKHPVCWLLKSYYLELVSKIYLFSLFKQFLPLSWRFWSYFLKFHLLSQTLLIHACNFHQDDKTNINF